MPESEHHEFGGRVVPSERSLERIPIISEYVRQLWQKYPEWRLGQLLCNLNQVAHVNPDASVWDFEDAEIIPAIRKLLGGTLHVHPPTDASK